MNKNHALRSLCAKCIAPAIAAMVFAATGGEAFASLAGQQAIEQKLTPQYIPTLKVNTSVLKAKPADLLLAISLVLQDTNVNLTAEEVAAGALETEGGKYRADKDKLAGQVIATAAAARNLSNNGPALALLAKTVFSVNGSDPVVKSRLTAAGQAGAVAGALKAAGSASLGNNIGLSIASVAPSGDTAVKLLLTNTVTALGTSAPAAAGTLTNFVDGLFDANAVVAANREGFTKGVADAVAAKSAASAGAVFGGLVLNNPAGAYTTDLQKQTLLSNLFTDTKVTKAFGEIVANVAATATDKVTLSQHLNGGTSSATLKPLITQGLLRAASSGTIATEVNGIIDGAGVIADKAKFAAIAAVGTGGNAAKVTAIASKLAGGLDVTKKTAVGLAVITALGSASPADAKSATFGVFDSTGGGFGDNVARQKFGTDIVGKLKTYASAGYVAAGIVERDTNQNAQEAATVAGALMLKGTKAATDIAQQVSSLAIAGSKLTFADTLADTAPKFVQNVAVGLSLADITNTGLITANAIKHNGLLDKVTIAKAATIASAVASAVDEEQISQIAKEVSSLMVVAPTSTQPVKLSLISTLATGLAKAIQTKPGVTNFNRMDELGEVAASLTAGAINKNTSDTKGLAAEAKLIATIGTSILKSLNKVATLPGNPNSNTNASLITRTQTFKADLWEARDIAGSIAQTILNDTTMTTQQKNTLLGVSTGATTHSAGTLEKAFLVLSGKKLSPTYLAVIQAFDDVIHGLGGSKFETGSDPEPFKETDNKNG